MSEERYGEGLFRSLFGGATVPLTQAERDNNTVRKIWADFRWQVKVQQHDYDQLCALIDNCIDRIRKGVKLPEVAERAVGGFMVMKNRLSEFRTEDGSMPEMDWGDKPYRVIEPEEREKLPAIWQGFDLRGMRAGQEFYGCQPCGVQFLPGIKASYPECPICTKAMRVFTVTIEDEAAGADL